MTATQPESTGVATRPKREVAPEAQAKIEEIKSRNLIVAQIRGTMWGKDCSLEVQRAVAEYCRQNNLDAVRHVEMLGGRIYLTAALYDEKGAHLLRSGEVQPEEPDYINADARLDEDEKAGLEWAETENARRRQLRIKYNAPEKALAIVVQKFVLPSSGKTIVGVNWCGGGSRRSDPVGDTEPAKTAQTRARRRAWTQIADVIPGYAELIRPLEANARMMSEQIPVQVVDAPVNRPLIGAGTSGYDEPAKAEEAHATPVKEPTEAKQAATCTRCSQSHRFENGEDLGNGDGSGFRFSA